MRQKPTHNDGTLAANRRFAILRALAQIDKPTMTQLIQETGIPKPSLHRHIADLRASFFMDIVFNKSWRSGGEGKGATGFYEVLDWGVFNQDEFQKKPE